jgi:AraC-like DNA-binding protein
VVNFMPELVCSPVSYPCDSTYLAPFYFRLPELEPVLRATNPDAADVQASLGRLLKCYFTEAPGPRRQAGCKAHLLQALYYLAKHFGVSDAGAIEFDGWRRQSLRFGRLYEHLRENYAEPITVAQAGEMVGLSQFRFMKFFKKTTGMTFVTYLTNLRLSNAHRLLTETSLSIAEIAATIGFADQSYFDRRFRMLYKQSPRQVRTAAGSSK